MVNSRTKGRAGEQEVARILRDELRLEIHRNWQEQAAQGGTDIIGVPGWAIEVKRQKKWSDDWWGQCCAQALKVTQKPVLSYRLDRQQWYAMVSLYHLRPEMHDHSPCRMALASWCKLVRLELDAT